MSEQSKKLLGSFAQIDVPAHPKSPLMPKEMAAPVVAPRPVKTDAVSTVAAGATSERPKPREKQPVPVTKERQRRMRRLHTADNVKFSHTIERTVSDEFYTVANAQGWTMKETLTRALKALQSELSRK